MENVEILTFLEQGGKQVIRIIAAPQKFVTEEQAKAALATAVRNYQIGCGKGYNTYYAPDNPFVAIIIHGINT